MVRVAVAFALLLVASNAAARHHHHHRYPIGCHVVYGRLDCIPWWPFSIVIPEG